MSLAEPPLAPVEDRATRILDEVERLAQDHGTRDIVMADVARDLGMSTKTLYREFPSKDALVGAIVDRWSARLVAAEDCSTGPRGSRRAGAFDGASTGLVPSSVLRRVLEGSVG